MSTVGRLILGVHEWFVFSFKCAARVSVTGRKSLAAGFFAGFLFQRLKSSNTRTNPIPKHTNMTARAVMARALYDFTGDPAVRQLTFKKNDLIKVTHQYENGWWAGELNGKAGYLPSTYIKIEEGRSTPATSPGGGKSTLTAPVQPAPTSKPSPPTAPKPSTPSSGGGLATYSGTFKPLRASPIIHLR